MKATRRQTVFAGLDQPRSWPPTPGSPRPERLAHELGSLAGVGAALTRKLARLGLRTVGDVLEHAPRRYESAADEVSIASLGPDAEVVIACQVLEDRSGHVAHAGQEVVRPRSAGTGGAAAGVAAARRDQSG